MSARERRAADSQKRDPQPVGRKPLVRTGPWYDAPFRRTVTAKRPRLGPRD